MQRPAQAFTSISDSFITSIFNVSKIKTLGFSLKHYISSLSFLPIRIMTSRQKNDKYLLLTLTKWPLKRLDSLSCSLWQRQIALIIICSTYLSVLVQCSRKMVQSKNVVVKYFLRTLIYFGLFFVFCYFYMVDQMRDFITDRKTVSSRFEVE